MTIFFKLFSLKIVLNVFNYMIESIVNVIKGNNDFKKKPTKFMTKLYLTLKSKWWLYTFEFPWLASHYLDCYVQNDSVTIIEIELRDSKSYFDPLCHNFEIHFKLEFHHFHLLLSIFVCFFPFVFFNTYFYLHFYKIAFMKHKSFIFTHLQGLTAPSSLFSNDWHSRQKINTVDLRTNDSCLYFGEKVIMFRDILRFGLKIYRQITVSCLKVLYLLILLFLPDLLLTNHLFFFI